MARQAQERTGKGKSRRVARRVGGVALGLLIALIVLALGLLLSINSRSGKNWLLQQVVAQAQEKLPGLTIERLEGFLPFEVVLKGIRVDDREGDPLLSVRQVVADPSFWPLLSQTLQLEELRIIQPQVQLAVDEQGRWNFSQLLAKQQPTAKEPSDWDMVVRALTLTGGEIVLQPDKGPPTRLHQLQVRGELAYHGDEGSAKVRELRARYELGETKGQLSAQLQGQLTEELIDALVKGQILPAEGETIPFLVVAEGPPEQLEAKLRIGREAQPVLLASGTVDTRAGSYKLQGRLNELATGWLPLELPPALVSLSLQAAGQGVPLERGSKLEAQLTSSGLVVGGQHIESIALHARTQGRSWELEQLRASGSGLELRADGSGTELESFQLTGRLSAQNFGPLQLQGGKLRLHGTAAFEVARHDGQQITLAGETAIKRLSLGGNQLRGLVATLSGQLQPEQGQANITFSAPSTFRVNELRLARLKAELQADGRELTLAAQVAPTLRRGRRLKAAQLQATVPLVPGSFRPDQNKPLQATVSWERLPVSELGRLANLKQQVRGQLTLWAEASGTLAAPNLRARLTLANGRGAGLRGVAGRLQLQASPHGTVARLRARLGPHPLLWGRLSLAAGPRELAQRWRQVPLELSARLSPIDPHRLGELSQQLPDVRGKLGGTLTASGSLLRPELRLQGRLARRVNGKLHRLQTQLQATGRPGRSQLQATVALDDRQLLRLRGSVALSPLQLAGRPASSPRFQLQGKVQPTKIAALATFFPDLAELDGRVIGNLKVAGQLPVARGGLFLAVKELQVRDRPLGDLEATATLQDQQVSLQVNLGQKEGYAALAFWSDDDGAARASLQVEQLKVAPLRQLISFGQAVEDKVSVRVQARGSIQSQATTALGRLLQPELITADVDVEDLRAAININWRSVPKPDVKPRKLDEVLKSAPPFRLRRLAVTNSTLKLFDPSLEGAPGLTLDKFALTLENLTSRRQLAQRVPAVMTFRTVIQGSGETVGFFTIDPLSEKPLAAGRIALRGLKLDSLQEWLVPTVGAKAPEGVFSCFAVFKLRGNQLTGSIKPLIYSLELEPAESASLWKSIAIEAADLTNDLLTLNIGEKNDALATVVPIKGQLDDPGIQLVPAILGVVRDAFVVGLVSGFTTIPLDIAPQKESIFSQAAQALVGENWLKTQPEEE